ncbi:MAG: hypothetical protein HQK52_12100 [Oligoflexia bacterium]|nr:hypothetical protein [Oligoflexia bacterium]
MMAKKITSIILGAFVLSSVVFLVVSEARKSDSADKNTEIEIKNNVQVVENKTTTQDNVSPKKSKYVDGLYFHSTNRCMTCNLMEGYIRDVLKDSFNKEIEEGSLTFKSINIDEASSSHYIQDYQLQSISFFLSLKKDGKEVKFENVDKIWQLARNEDAFKKYIKAEIKKFVEM